MSSLTLDALRYDAVIVRKQGIPFIGPVAENQPPIPTGFRLVAIVRGMDHLFDELFTDAVDVTHPLYYAEFFSGHERRAKYREYREMKLFLLPEAFKSEDGRSRIVAA